MEWIVLIALWLSLNPNLFINLTILGLDCGIFFKQNLMALDVLIVLKALLIYCRLNHKNILTLAHSNVYINTHNIILIQIYITLPTLLLYLFMYSVKVHKQVKLKLEAHSLRILRILSYFNRINIGMIIYLHQLPLVLNPVLKHLLCPLANCLDIEIGDGFISIIISLRLSILLLHLHHSLNGVFIFLRIVISHLIL